tara:strand:+ start:763 stop:2145 length:1383 start_codon:yes stop_codon:yes gene_type:complete
MPVTLEISYFNSFYVKKLQKSDPADSLNQVGDVWNGPVADQDQDWYIEESRIRGGFNNTSVDFGVKAYIVEEQDQQTRRQNSLIYSGIFNSRTGINQTNQFSVAEEITRSVDPIGGSIQKLFAEDTNLTIFQERKVNVALIDKDAIFTAEGGAISTNANIVIGQITPILGNWGISKNPESFAYYGYDKYFTDRSRNAVLKLAGNQIEEISSTGMTDFFRDQLSSIGISSTGKAVGGYDIYNNNYVLSLQGTNYKFSNTDTSGYKTLAYDSKIQGWTSFFKYKPDQIFSLQGQYYTAFGSKIYKHYVNADRNNFYGTKEPSQIKFIFNPEPQVMKTFKTVNYEGSNGWEATSIISENTGATPTGSNHADVGARIYSYDEGAYIDNNIQYRAGFYRKQNNYQASIINNTSTPMAGEVVFGNSMTGIKAYYATVTLSTDATTDNGGLKQLFAVGSEYITINTQ